MKYFLDTEFLEGSQKTWFGPSKPTIDLISIGIVAEDGREYYAISNEFNLKEAWNRWQPESEDTYMGTYKDYWIRDNVLKPIHYELAKKEVGLECSYNKWTHLITSRENGVYADRHYKTLKKLINKYGKSNKQIAEEVMKFTSTSECRFVEEYGDKPEFYGYYADYDWVVFCWLFGKMIDLPKGFPMYCIDLKQTLDEKVNQLEWLYGRDIWSNSNRSIHTIGKGNQQEKDRLATFDEKLRVMKNLSEYPNQTNEHNALSDAKWNYELYKFIKSLK